ncbi:sortase family protein, LPXTG-site transpeptidase [Terriglobus roseus DSM 18391]|uniref:Sortase family protein, LPXTG-site transpeptidase n=1 Tax=Terriglobus roseus (strain DSM 18391 / NRRL B-41598 / KBS 63) TaxID=926566 RepID=I3ZD04_TERRK|nr:class D sortase [Terriglobus roseus]AFL87122.1 sortase family protein, LPXTG-site transpeptidase [Terriglobus roseus DSM 18391]
MQSVRVSTTQWISRICMLAGTVLLGFWCVPMVYGLVFSHVVLARFQAHHAETMAWAPGRVAAYRDALKVAAPPATAVLRIPRVGIEVPVMEGTSKLVMNLGAGHIEGTASPGGAGNVALASHRDGYFRHLKDVRVGDRIEMSTAQGTDVYQVEQLQVVSPRDVSSLQPTAKPVLTLVTCYPFFYLGPAPQRYIVRASLLSTSLLSTNTAAPSLER